MPILPREPDIFPDDLFERLAAEGLGERRWQALYTLARKEKELMRRLRARAIPFYGPIVAQVSRTPAGRKITSHVPLFPGYVFLLATPEERVFALTTNCVSRTLDVPDSRELTTDLAQIQRVIASGAPLATEPSLEPGQRVRIRSGALMGIEGVVRRRHGSEQLIIEVRFLQQGASLQLADYAVEIVES